MAINFPLAYPDKLDGYLAGWPNSIEAEPAKKTGPAKKTPKAAKTAEAKPEQEAAKDRFELADKAVSWVCYDHLFGVRCDPETFKMKPGAKAEPKTAEVKKPEPEKAKPVAHEKKAGQNKWENCEQYLMGGAIRLVCD